MEKFNYRMPRFALKNPLSVDFVVNGPLKFQGECNDIGMDGVAVSFSTSIAVGTEGDLTLLLSDGRRPKIRARVIYNQKERHGLSFVGDSKEYEEIKRKLITENE